MISFRASKEDTTKMIAIIDRVRPMLGSIAYTYQEMLMDLTACHANGCPLDLDSMIVANDLDLIHDILGIRQHLNRRTGKLENCFDPRLSAKTEFCLCGAPMKDGKCSVEGCVASGKQ